MSVTRFLLGGFVGWALTTELRRERVELFDYSNGLGITQRATNVRLDHGLVAPMPPRISVPVSQPYGRRISQPWEVD